MGRDDVYKLGDGAVYSGNHAYQYGLVDTLGGYEDALRLAAEMAGIDGEPETVRMYEPKRSIYDILGSFFGGIEKISSGDIGGPRVMYLY
jgi:protease-4